MSSFDALRVAQERGLDLVEVAPTADPPVCRIMDYGKFKYQTKKKAAEARKHQTVVTIKEVKFRPKIDDHDIETKLRQIQRFLEEGDKVRIFMQFRGREMAHLDLGKALLDRVVKELQGKAEIEQSAKMEGKAMFLLLAPARKGGGSNAPRSTPTPAAPPQGK